VASAALTESMAQMAQTGLTGLTVPMAHLAEAAVFP